MPIHKSNKALTTRIILKVFLLVGLGSFFESSKVFILLGAVEMIV